MTTANMPIRIGHKTCKNRITMAPTVKFTAGTDGIVTDFFVRHYELRARGMSISVRPRRSGKMKSGSGD